MPLPTACCAAAAASPVASSPSRPRASHLLFAFRRLRNNREPVEAAARFVKVYSIIFTVERCPLPRARGPPGSPWARPPPPDLLAADPVDLLDAVEDDASGGADEAGWRPFGVRVSVTSRLLGGCFRSKVPWKLRRRRVTDTASSPATSTQKDLCVIFIFLKKSIKCCVAKGHNSTDTSNEASNGHLPGSSNPQRLVAIRFCPNDRHGKTNMKSNGSLLRQGRNVHCRSYGPRNTSETKECKNPENGNDPYRDFEERQRGKSQFSDNQVPGQKKSLYSSNGLSKACQFAYNDAKFVNERAQNDIILLSRGITRLNKRASQDVAVLGLGFLKLDARARKDTQKIDNTVKERAAHLTNFARILKERAKSDLKKAADQHWSDGALEADLRRADMVVRRRAMEDAFMALKFVRDIHDMMANKLQDQLPANGSFSPTNSTRFITLEKNGKNLELFPHEVSTDQIAAIEEAYLSMASALSEADGIDYTDPDELELLVAALIDLDAMDGKKSVSLIAECSSSPDVNTRKALANALAAAPSMWTLGNAGMGALQRLAQDSNYAVSRSASRAIDELRKQWELEEGDSLRFVMNQKSALEETDDDDSAADDITT